MSFKELFIKENFEEIAKLTDDNNHSEARILGAQILKDKKLEKVYTAIKDIHSYFGYLPSELSKLRYEIDKEMFKIAKSKLGDKFEEFKGSF